MWLQSVCRWSERMWWCDIYYFLLPSSGSACTKRKWLLFGEGWMAGKKEMAHGHKNNNSKSTYNYTLSHIHPITYDFSPLRMVMLDAWLSLQFLPFSVSWWLQDFCFVFGFFRTKKWWRKITRKPQTRLDRNYNRETKVLAGLSIYGVDNALAYARSVDLHVLPTWILCW